MRRIGKHVSGFTLLELVVVIAIITILVGLLFPAFQAVQNSAKKTQAKNDLTQIVTAANAFYTEYGKYPLPSTATTDTIYGPEGTSSADLFYTLRAVPLGANLNNAVNTRQIVFISPPDVKDTTNPRAGIGTDGQWYDPWGTRYNVEIDGNYTNQIEVNPYPDTDGSAGARQLRFGVISWSYGNDLTKGTKTPVNPNFKGSDDVISWQ